MEAKSRFFFHDKCIKCSPSRAQHIVHSKFPAVKDDREQYNKMFWDKYERSKYENYIRTHGFLYKRSITKMGKLIAEVDYGRMYEVA